ncbi:MAG: DoxX family protein [Balneola sp.]
MPKLDINLTFLTKHKDLGLLILRLGVGLSYLFLHGWGKITGGPERWIGLGKNMPGFGIDAIYMIWGFMAAFAESIGALLFALGYKYRLMAALLFITMLVATIFHLERGDGFKGASHAMKMMFVFFGLMMMSPGKYSLDEMMKK